MENVKAVPEHSPVGYPAVGKEKTGPVKGNPALGDLLELVEVSGIIGADEGCNVLLQIPVDADVVETAERAPGKVIAAVTAEIHIRRHLAAAVGTGARIALFSAVVIIGGMAHPPARGCLYCQSPAFLRSGVHPARRRKSSTDWDNNRQRCVSAVCFLPYYKNLLLELKE